MATIDSRDQDSLKATPTPASKRLSSVWSDRRQSVMSPDSSTVTSTSPGRLLSPQEELRLKRVEAARWIEDITGACPVPHGSEREFRACLRDGVLLCMLINRVAPGSTKVIEPADKPQHRLENLQNFLKQAQAMGAPSECLFSIADLEYECNSEEQSQVVECIVWLKRLHEGMQGAGLLGGMQGELTSTGESSPSKDAQKAAARALQKMPGLPLSSAPVQPGAPALQPGVQGSSISAAQHKGIQSSVGVARLMQQCTFMMRERMEYSVDISGSVQATAQLAARSADTFSFEAVGPVLESVLGGLTQEYERRLLAKDQEIQATKEKMLTLKRNMEQLTLQLNQLRNQLEDQEHRQAIEASSASLAQAKELEGKVEEMQSALQAREQHIQELREQLDCNSTEMMQRSMQLERELQVAQEQVHAAEQIAANYRSMQEENRKLYNLVQDLKGSIRVFCRVRPLGRTGDHTASCVDVGTENELAIYDSRGERKVFKFDHVFDQGSTQEDIYADTQPLVRSVLDGYNVCIFAYGQTGSGKTHTMSGTHVEDPTGRGINYRALDDLFALQERRQNEVEYTITVQMLEVYNESLRDLLVEHGAAPQKLDLLNTQPSGCNVPGANKVAVYSSGDVLRIMDRGSRNRHMAETKMNERSSRSHQVLTVIVDGINKVTGVRSHGCLNLVDLAGSERVNKSEATGERLKEATNINTSLSSLGDVMAALASKAKHVPFRNSMLTQLLADSLSGQAKVMMFIHIAPEGSSYSESNSTLEFARRVSSITLGQAKKNVESGEVFKAHEEIGKLQRQQEEKDRKLHELMAQLQRERQEKENLLSKLEKAQRHATHSEANTPYHSVGGSVDSKPQHSFMSPAAVKTPMAQPSFPGTPHHATMPAINEDSSGASSAMAAAAAASSGFQTPQSARMPSQYQATKTLGAQVRQFVSSRQAGVYGSTSSAVGTSATNSTTRQAMGPPPPVREMRESLSRESSLTKLAETTNSAASRSLTALPTSSRTTGVVGATRPVSGIPNAPGSSARGGGVYKPASAVRPVAPGPMQDAAKPIPQSAGNRRSIGGSLWK